MGKRLRSNVSLEEAAEELGIWPEELEWAIGEFGLCDDEERVVVEAGDPFPG